MPTTVASATEARADAKTEQNTIRSQGTSGKAFWQELVSRVASSAGIDPDLAVRVAFKESGLNPGALNPASGAVGMMQLMPATAAAMGLDPRNTLENVVGGVQYLREQLSHFGDEAKALAAYNWGPGRVAEAVEHWGAEWLSHAPRETQQYVSSILSSPGFAPTAQAPPAHEKVASSLEFPASLASSLPPAGPDPRLTSEAIGLNEALNAYLIAAILSSDDNS